MKQLLIGDNETGYSFAQAHRDGIEYVAIEHFQSDEAKAFDKQHSDVITVSMLDASEVVALRDWLNDWLDS